MLELASVYDPDIPAHENDEYVEKTKNYLKRYEEAMRGNSAAFASHAAIPTERFRWTRGEELIQRYESSPGGFRWFCRRCGSHLTGVMSDPPGEVIVISVGSLDADPGSRPVAHEMRSSRH